MKLSRDEAIGYALLETDHLPGFAARGPAFTGRLNEVGWAIVAAESRRRRALRRILLMLVMLTAVIVLDAWPGP